MLRLLNALRAFLLLLCLALGAAVYALALAEPHAGGATLRALLGAVTVVGCSAAWIARGDRSCR